MTGPEDKYPALRVIATIYRIAAFIAGILCIVVGLVILAAGIRSAEMAADKTDAFLGAEHALLIGFLGALVMLSCGAILFLVLYGAGEFIYVVLDIEENTRLRNCATSAQAFENAEKKGSNVHDAVRDWEEGMSRGQG